MDEDGDGLLDLREFSAVMMADLKMDLKQNESKNIYLHQPLDVDLRLDLSDFFDQIQEEFLSFPEATAIELLRRYFAKILQEAAPFERLNQFLVDRIMHISPHPDSPDVDGDEEAKESPDGL